MDNPFSFVYRLGRLNTSFLLPLHTSTSCSGGGVGMPPLAPSNSGGSACVGGIGGSGSVIDTVWGYSAPFTAFLAVGKSAVTSTVAIGV